MRKRTATTLIVAGTVLVATYAWFFHIRRFVWYEHNVREVEPLRVYAGGYHYPIPLRRLVRRYQIKTVVSLRGDLDEPQAQERAVLAALGVRYYNISLDVAAPDELIARAKSVLPILADPNNQPVYVHCWAGRHRTGVVVGMYRMVHGGWTEAAARAEAARWSTDDVYAQWIPQILQAFAAKERGKATSSALSR